MPVTLPLSSAFLSVPLERTGDAVTSVAAMTTATKAMASFMSEVERRDDLRRRESEPEIEIEIEGVRCAAEPGSTEHHAVDGRPDMVARRRCIDAQWWRLMSLEGALSCRSCIDEDDYQDEDDDDDAAAASMISSDLNTTI